MKIGHPKTGGVVEITDEQFATFADAGWKRAPDDEPTDEELRSWYYDNRPQNPGDDPDVQAIRETWHSVYDEGPAGVPDAPPSKVKQPAPKKEK